MNTRELDRLLCERLGIEGRASWYVGIPGSPQAPESNRPWFCYCGGEEACRRWITDHPDYSERNRVSVYSLTHYPALSTTGEGMLRLMEALRADGHDHRMEGDGYGLFRGSIKPRMAGSYFYGERSDSAPLALALAAARALGIGVPE